MNIPRQIFLTTSFITLFLLIRLCYTFFKLSDNNSKIEESIQTTNKIIRLRDSKKDITNQLGNLEELIPIITNNQERQQIIQNISQIKEQIENLPESIDVQSQINLSQDFLKIRTDISRNYNSHIATIVQAIGAAFFLITAYFSWLNIKNTKDSQTAERLSKALEFISGDTPQKCLTGIYLLENLIEDSQEDSWSVIRILADLIKNKSALPDIQDIEKYKQCIYKALGMIAYYNQKIDRNVDKNLIDLQNSYLQGIQLNSDAHLEYVNLDGANLGEAKLHNVNFSNSSLKNVNLTNSDLPSANFYNAQLQKSNFSEAGLFGANFTEADIYDTNFTNAEIQQAQFMQNKGFDPLQIRVARNWEHANFDKGSQKLLIESAN